MIIKVYTQILDSKGEQYNDTQEVFVKVSETGQYLAQWPNVLGSDSVPGIWRKEAYNAKRQYVGQYEYAKIAELPSPSYAYQVPTYSHLRYA